MKRLLICSLAVCVSAVTALPAQARKAQKSVASIEGDVYLVMQSGDTKKASGQTVELLRETTTTALDRLQLCQRFEIATAPLAESVRATEDTLKGYVPADRRMSLINRQTIVGKRLDSLRRAVRMDMLKSIADMERDTSGTGLAAHYKFSPVKPGSYVLYGTWSVGENAYIWWAPITAKAGESIKRDLDNSVESSKSIFCGA